MFNGIESAYDSENVEGGHTAPEPTGIQPKVFQLGPKNPNWRESFKKATRREFSERFDPYDLGDRDAALEYYKKHQHLF
jgi:hypothetical protein